MFVTQKVDTGLMGVIERFAHHLISERYLSVLTAKVYTADLLQFGQFLTGTPAEISTATVSDQVLLATKPDDVKNYLEFMRQNNYSVSSMARKLASLRSFFKFCIRKKMTTNNPMFVVRMPKVGRRAPKFMTEGQIAELLRIPNPNTEGGLRDRAILECLYSTGIRTGELYALNVSDVDLAGKVIRVLGKGRRKRFAPLSQTAKGALENYFSERGVESGVTDSAAPLFLNKKEGRLSQRSVRRALDKYVAEAGFDSGICPNTLRHSCAVHMLNHGADFRGVQEFMCHQNVATTLLYRPCVANTTQANTPAQP